MISSKSWVTITFTPSNKEFLHTFIVQTFCSKKTEKRHDISSNIKVMSGLKFPSVVTVTFTVYTIQKKHFYILKINFQLQKKQ